MKKTKFKFKFKRLIRNKLKVFVYQKKKNTTSASLRNFLSVRRKPSVPGLDRWIRGSSKQQRGCCRRGEPRKRTISEMWSTPFSGRLIGRRMEEDLEV